MFNGTRDDSWELYCKVGRVKSTYMYSRLLSLLQGGKNLHGIWNLMIKMREKIEGCHESAKIE